MRTIHSAFLNVPMPGKARNLSPKGNIVLSRLDEIELNEVWPPWSATGGFSGALRAILGLTFRQIELPRQELVWII